METKICFTFGEFIAFILLSFIVRYFYTLAVGKKNDTFTDYTSTAFMSILFKVISLLL